MAEIIEISLTVPSLGASSSGADVTTTQNDRVIFFRGTGVHADRIRVEAKVGTGWDYVADLRLGEECPIPFPTTQVRITRTGGTSTGLECKITGTEILGGVAGDKGDTGDTGPAGPDTYTAGTPGDWAGSPPVTFTAAVDRLAALAKTLNTGTGA